MNKRTEASFIVSTCIILMMIVVPLGAWTNRYAVACYGEAEGEPFWGKVALCEAIRNRGTLRGVYGVDSPRTATILQNPNANYKACQVASVLSIFTRITKGATHWESDLFRTPYWARSMVKTTKIGHHQFYKEAK